jgi:hypothetical protein
LKFYFVSGIHDVRLQHVDVKTKIVKLAKRQLNEKLQCIWQLAREVADFVDFKPARIIEQWEESVKSILPKMF